MRKTYRRSNNKDYWTKRWSDIPADLAMKNKSKYPLKYAEMMIENNRGRILEAGCGAGRILRYYHNLNYEIIGIDFIDIAIEKIKKVDSSLNVEVGDIKSLRFDDNYFQYILAFGLFHNLEHGLKDSIAESYRILKNGGSICASFRADNLQTKLVDFLASLKEKKINYPSTEKKFHKMNLTKKEFTNLFTKVGFNIEFIEPVENMPILYKFSFFRHKSHKKFNENLARKEGYKLSWYGLIIQKILMTLMPYQFCNIYVLIARKS